MNGNSEPVLGVIGGSGLYQIEGLANQRWETVESPFGAPSDQLCFGELNGRQLVFLPRHGRGHKLSPTDINFRANIDVLKRVGVTEIVSLSAVGSLREDLPPGHFVIVDQFIDRTFAREKSFFGTGCVAHVSMAHPTCGRLAKKLADCAAGLGIPFSSGGIYMVMEGPQFSSYAESMLYRSWGCSVIGMTNMPEAKLAREAEICYATVGMVTDFDCWHEDHDAVSVEAVIKVLLGNADKGRDLVREISRQPGQAAGTCPMGCQTALDNAIITAPEARDPQVLKRLDAVAGRVLAG